MNNSPKILNYTEIIQCKIVLYFLFRKVEIGRTDKKGHIVEVNDCKLGIKVVEREMKVQTK